MPQFKNGMLHVTYIVIRCTIWQEDGPPIPQDEQVTGFKKVKVVGNGLSSLLLIVIVLGSILFGVATPTEAGAIGAGFMALFYRKFGFSEFWDGALETARLTGIVVWMLIGAKLLTNFNLLMGISSLVTSHFESLGLGSVGTIILMNAIMFLIGFILDEYIIVLIAGPIFVSIVICLGLDTVWHTYGPQSYSCGSNATLWFWSSPGLMDTFHLKKESVFHAENEEPVPDGIQGSIGCACAIWAQC